MSPAVPKANGRRTTALVILVWLGSACAAHPAPQTSTVPAISQQPPPIGDARPESRSTALATGGTTTLAPAPPDAGNASTAPPSAAPVPMQQGVGAPNARVRFVPREIDLPGGNSTVVEPAQTVDGALQVPVDVGHVGWWDGSSYAGDPFGSTVIAGHVDSREQGLGFFAELLLVQVGDLVTLRSDANALTYRVVSTTLVQKETLVSDSQAFDQSGPHRLVLITCSGQWHAELHSYDSNLVVVADPIVG